MPHDPVLAGIASTTTNVLRERTGPVPMFIGIATLALGVAAR